MSEPKSMNDYQATKQATAIEAYRQALRTLWEMCQFDLNYFDDEWEAEYDKAVDTKNRIQNMLEEKIGKSETAIIIADEIEKLELQKWEQEQKAND